jgi:hypothetical protein
MVLDVFATFAFFVSVGVEGVVAGGDLFRASSAGASEGDAPGSMACRSSLAME